jgi:D-alanyl-D-alanine carboxypeptidase (penicillin-binding protein 5/6)
MDDITVKRGSVNRVAVRIQEDRYITLPKEASLSLISVKIVMDESVTAPVEAGQALGRVEIYEGSEIIVEVPVVAESDIPEGMFLSRFGIEDSVSETVIRYAITVSGIVGFFILLYIILKIRYASRRKSRRRARALQIAKERERKQMEMEQRRWPY